MAAISAARDCTTGQLRENTARPLADRVTASAQEIFQQIKEQICLFWEAAVFCIRDCCTDITFLFFRTADFFNPPTVMSRIELAWVYTTSRWTMFWAQRTEAALTAENQMLAGRIQQLTSDMEHLRLRLNREFVEKRLIIETNERLTRENETLQRDLKAVLPDRDAVVRENGILAQQAALLNQKKKTPPNQPATEPLAEVLSLLSPAQERWIAQLMNPSKSALSP